MTEKDIEDKLARVTAERDTANTILALIFTVTMLDAMWRKYITHGVFSVVLTYFIVGALFSSAIIMKTLSEGHKRTVGGWLRLFTKTTLVWLFASWISPIRKWMWS